MPVVIPHTFTSNTNIEGPEVQANNNAIKNWLNGGFSPAPTDVLTGKWIKASMIMNGYYNAIINQFEFTTGLVQGNPEFPKFNPGGTSIAIGDANGDLTVSGSGFILVPVSSSSGYISDVIDTTTFASASNVNVQLVRGTSINPEPVTVKSLFASPIATLVPPRS